MIKIFNMELGLTDFKIGKSGNSWYILTVKDIGNQLTVRLKQNRHALNHLGTYRTYKYKTMVTLELIKFLLEEARKEVADFAERFYQSIYNPKASYTYKDSDTAYEGGDLTPLLLHIATTTESLDHINVTLRDKTNCTLMLDLEIAKKFKLTKNTLRAIGNQVFAPISKSQRSKRFVYSIKLSPEACYFLGNSLMDVKFHLANRILGFADDVSFEGYELSLTGNKVIRDNQIIRIRKEK